MKDLSLTQRQEDEGFTLIELLVVIAIIGILAAAAIPQVLDAICNARVSGAESSVATIRTAFVQCQVASGCDTSTTALTDAQWDDFLTGGVQSDWNISVANGNLTSVWTTDVGCEWNDGTSDDNGLCFNVENGEFLAQSTDCG